LSIRYKVRLILQKTNRQMDNSKGLILWSMFGIGGRFRCKLFAVVARGNELFNIASLIQASQPWWPPTDFSILNLSAFSSFSTDYPSQSNYWASQTLDIVRLQELSSHEQLSPKERATKDLITDERIHKSYRQLVHPCQTKATSINVWWQNAYDLPDDHFASELFWSQISPQESHMCGRI